MGDVGEKYECCSLSDASTASGASLEELSECNQQDRDGQVELDGGCHRDVPLLRFKAVRWKDAVARAEQIAAVYRPVQPNTLPPQLRNHLCNQQRDLSRILGNLLIL